MYPRLVNFIITRLGLSGRAAGMYEWMQYISCISVAGLILAARVRRRRGFRGGRPPPVQSHNDKGGGGGLFPANT